MTSTPPPPEVDIPNAADTEIPVQVEQVNAADDSTEDNLTDDSNTQNGTPTVKEKSPIAKNNAKQILDKRKNNDEEVKSKVDGDESTIGLCKITQARRKDLNFRRSRSILEILLGRLTRLTSP